MAPNRSAKKLSECPVDGRLNLSTMDPVDPLAICHLSSTDEAFVTLATTDGYARGAMVLGKSLRNHNTSKRLVALIGPQVSEPCR